MRCWHINIHFLLIQRIEIKQLCLECVQMTKAFLNYNGLSKEKKKKSVEHGVNFKHFNEWAAFKCTIKRDVLLLIINGRSLQVYKTWLIKLQTRLVYSVNHSRTSHSSRMFTLLMKIIQIKECPGSTQANLLTASVKCCRFTTENNWLVLQIVETNKYYNGSLWDKTFQRV